MSPEPTAVRDNGPYESLEQVMKQFDAVTYGLPMWTSDKVHMALREAVLIAGVVLSSFEEELLRDLCHRQNLPAESATMLAGLMIRAHLAGASVNTRWTAW